MQGPYTISWVCSYSDIFVTCVIFQFTVILYYRSIHICLFIFFKSVVKLCYSYARIFAILVYSSREKNCSFQLFLMMIVL